jgi:16S rRNA (guanine527-N7)-methyltransferase
VKHSDSLQQISQFKNICSSWGIQLSNEMINKFQDYATLLLDWNKRIHLVSKRDATADRIIRHFVDSLSIFRATELPDGINILDIGSGAGFPSIPIKIVREDLKLTLVESIHKKALFLQKLCEILRLQNTSILNQRAENLLEDRSLGGEFDLVTAKGLGKLDTIVRLGMPFLKMGGQLIVYKGKGVKKEIDEINLQKNSQIKDMAKIEILEIDLFRWLIVIEKVK